MFFKERLYCYLSLYSYNVLFSQFSELFEKGCINVSISLIDIIYSECIRVPSFSLSPAPGKIGGDRHAHARNENGASTRPYALETRSRKLNFLINGECMREKQALAFLKDINQLFLRLCFCKLRLIWIESSTS